MPFDVQIGESRSAAYIFKKHMQWSTRCPTSSEFSLSIIQTDELGSGPSTRS